MAFINPMKDKLPNFSMPNGLHQPHEGKLRYY